MCEEKNGFIVENYIIIDQLRGGLVTTLLMKWSRNKT